MSEQWIENRSIGSSSGDEPAWVNTHFQKNSGAEREARESEERVAKLAEELAAQFTGK